MASDKRTDAATVAVAVHGGERWDEQPFGAVVSPVFHSVNFAFETFEQMRRYSRGELEEAYFYSRYANPTVSEVERKIAELEGAEACVVTSSGPQQGSARSQHFAVSVMDCPHRY